jgi:hypothetical protein
LCLAVGDDGGDGGSEDGCEGRGDGRGQSAGGREPLALACLGTRHSCRASDHSASRVRKTAAGGSIWRARTPACSHRAAKREASRGRVQASEKALASVDRYTALADGATSHHVAESRRAEWTSCMSSERARPLMAIAATTELSVKSETLKPCVSGWKARTPP